MSEKKLFVNIFKAMEFFHQNTKHQTPHRNGNNAMRKQECGTGLRRGPLQKIYNNKVILDGKWLFC